MCEVNIYQQDAGLLLSPWTRTTVMQHFWFFSFWMCNKCTKNQCFMSLYDAHRCLCRAAVGYQSHSHTLLSSSSNRHRVSSEKLQPRYFLWCWLAFTARSPRTTGTKSHFCRWQLFSLCDPQEVFSPWISPWISLLACLCRAGDWHGRACQLPERQNKWLAPGNLLYIPCKK